MAVHVLQKPIKQYQLKDKYYLEDLKIPLVLLKDYKTLFNRKLLMNIRI